MCGLDDYAACRKGFSVSARCQLVPLMHMGHGAPCPYRKGSHTGLPYNSRRDFLNTYQAVAFRDSSSSLAYSYYGAQAGLCVRTAMLVAPRTILLLSRNRTKIRFASGLKGMTVPVPCAMTVNVSTSPAPIVMVTLGP